MAPCTTAPSTIKQNLKTGGKKISNQNKFSFTKLNFVINKTFFFENY